MQFYIISLQIINRLTYKGKQKISQTLHRIHSDVKNVSSTYQNHSKYFVLIIL